MCWVMGCPHPCSRTFSPVAFQLSSATRSLIPTCRFARTDPCIGLSDSCIIVYALEFTLPIGPIHSAPDPVGVCSPHPPHPSTHSSVLHGWGEAWLPCSLHHLPPLNFPVSQGVSVGKDREQPFQRKQPWGPESRDVGLKRLTPVCSSWEVYRSAEQGSMLCVCPSLFLFFNLSLSSLCLSLC